MTNEINKILFALDDFCTLANPLSDVNNTVCSTLNQYVQENNSYLYVYVLGAGRFPTANSVLNDLIRLSVDKSSPPFPLSSDIQVNPDYTGTFYIRIKSVNGVGKYKQNQFVILL